MKELNNAFEPCSHPYTLGTRIMETGKQDDVTESFQVFTRGKKSLHHRRIYNGYKNQESNEH